MTKNKSVFILFILFAVSGFSGLIYESIWTHYLKLFLGHASYSQVLVLVIFMGGMAIGAWGVGHISSKIKNLLLGYAIVEGIIGILGILFHSVFINIIDYSFNTVIPNIDSSFSITLYKWLLGGLLILPQSILLGATFPLMTGGILRRSLKNPGKSIAGLYFANSLGASIGVLASGFFLIKKIGLPGTITVAGLLNIILAITIWVLFGKSDKKTVNIGKLNHINNQVNVNKMLLFLFLLTACLTGMSSFMYEIAWIRMLSFVLGSSTHAFELMLSAFILGLALGGFWIKNRIDKLKNIVLTLAIVQILMGVFAVSTLLFYDKLFDFMSFIISGLNKSEAGYLFFQILSHFICLITMLPPTIFAGMTLPIITHFLLKNKYGESSIGKVYGINTLGAILGVILSIQIILPFFGLKSLMIIAGAIDVIIGVVLLFKSNIFKVNKKTIISLILISSIVIIALSFHKMDYSKMASGVFRHGISTSIGDILYHKDGKTASIDVVKSGNDISLITNGKPEASMSLSGNLDIVRKSDEPGQILLGAIPLSINLNIKKAAIIGLGSGMTSSIVLKNPYLEQMDIIEIEPAVVEGATFFSARTGNIYKDKRCKIIIEDAKTYFSSNKEIYDLIVSVPSNPWVSGVSNLFSKEFYKLVKKYISNDGIFVQWMQKYEMNLELFTSVINALSTEFKYYNLYIARNSDILLIASNTKMISEPDSKIFRTRELKEELKRININSIDDIKSMKLGDKKLLNDFFLSFNTNPNSDYYPILDNNAERLRFLSEHIVEFDILFSLDIPILSCFSENYFYPESEKISKNPYVIKSIKMNEAIIILKYFRNILLNSNHQSDILQNLNKEVRQNILGIVEKGRGLYSNNKQFNEYLWLKDLRSIMRATINYLSPAQMSVIFKSIDSFSDNDSNQSLNISNKYQRWISLYKAISAKDYLKMNKLSYNILLEKKYGHINVIKESLYFALILSDIKLNNFKRAIETIADLEKNYKKIPVALRFLKAKLISKMSKK